MKTRVLFPALLALVCGVGGFVWGQNEQAESYRQAIRNSTALELKGYEGAYTASVSYGDAAQDTTQTAGIVQEALVDAYSKSDKKGEALAKLTALQAMQNARLIQQNDEIIALLKKGKD